MTQLEVFDHGGPDRRQAATAGEIAKVWGLHDVQIGDRLGGADAVVRQQFAPPTLEAVVEPVDPDAGNRLRVALDQLAEQDPLIGLRQTRQRAVGLDLRRRPEGGARGDARPRLRPRRRVLGDSADLRRTAASARRGGRAAERADEPVPRAARPARRAGARRDQAIAFGLGDITHDRIPLYAYKRREEFEAAMAEYVRDALRVGPHGWEVIDCVVTLTDCWYSLADGPPSRRGPLSMPADFRGLTGHVLAQALAEAGTVVCEPILHIRARAAGGLPRRRHGGGAPARRDARAAVDRGRHRDARG